MKLCFAGLAGLAVLSLAACAGDGGAAPDVKVLAADSTGLTPGGSYAWKDVSADMENARDPRIDTPELQKRMRAALDKALGDKGYNRAAEPAEAQMEVAYRIGVMQGFDSGQTVNMPKVAGFGGPGGVNCSQGGCDAPGWAWGVYGPPTATLAPTSFTEGSVMFDVYDRPTGRLVWQAIYSARVYGKEDGSQEALDAVARQLLKDLPGAVPGG